jgi:hypothetical protein
LVQISFGLSLMPGRDPDIAPPRLGRSEGPGGHAGDAERCYHLVLPDGSKWSAKDGSKALTAKELRALLMRLPDGAS